MCIFCKIINKEIDANIIYESKYSIGILDINPKSVGHTLLISKIHYDNYCKLDDTIYNHYMKDLKILTNIIKNKLNPDGFNLLCNINEVAGQEVMHQHFHIIPKYYNNPDIKDINKVLSKVIT